MPFFQQSRSPNVKKLQQERDMEGLLSVLADSTNELRASAADALGKLKDPRAVDALLTALGHDPASQVRTSVAKALGELRDARAVDPLITALHDPDVFVRANAADALGSIEDARAADPLFNILFKEHKEHDLMVAVAVMKALGRVADARTVEVLITIIEQMGTTEQPEGMPFEAAGASGEIEGTRTTEAWLAARMLGEIGGERATEALHALQKNQAYRKDVRKAAANSLWQIKSSQRKRR